MRIRHTLGLDRVVLSEACLPFLTGEMEVLAPPTECTFGEDGNFDVATDLLGALAARS